MKNFLTLFLAIVLGGGLVAGGFLLVQRDVAEKDRKSSIQNTAAKAALVDYIDWMDDAHNSADRIRWGAQPENIAAFCKVYKSTYESSLLIPESEKEKSRADLAELINRVLGYLPPGGPDSQRVRALPAAPSP